MKLNKFIYPAIFTPTKVGYSVIFPDLEGCQTNGDSLEEAINMATNTLSLYIFNRKELPKASNPYEINTNSNNSSIILIECSLKEKKKLVRKTIYITQEQEDLLIKFENLGYIQSEVMRRALDEYFEKEKKVL